MLTTMQALAVTARRVLRTGKPERTKRVTGDISRSSAPPKPRRWAIVTVVSTLALFAVALYFLDRTLSALSLDRVYAAIRQRSGAQVLAAVGFTLASYASLTLYDAIALRIVGRSLPYRRIALISFIASAVGNNLGLSSLSAGSVRMRAYGSEGLPAGEIALVQGLATATFALGAGSLLGVSLLLGAGRAASLLHVSGWAARLGGACLLAMLTAYVLCTALFRKPFRIRDWTLRLPSAPMTLGQIAVGGFDICCAAGCLYALLPATTGAGAAAFVGSFVLAITLGALSNVPGGLGVLESALLLLLPGVDPADLLGAALVFRAIYFVAPFGIALCLLGAQELTSLGRHVPRATSMGRRLVEAIAPQLLAMAVFGAGAVLLVSGALPAIGTRVELLRGWLPLPVLEISHLAGSAIGAALLILSRGLYRRMRGAFRLTQGLLAAGIAASLCKGIDYEEALILVCVMLLLHGARGRFYRRAAPEAWRVSPLGLLNVGLVILAVIWLGLMAFRHVPYTHDLFWQFAFDAEAPRMLRAASVIVLLGAGYGLWQLLTPAPRAPRTASPAEIERAAGCLGASTDALSNLVLLGDKQLLFSDDEAFIMYQRSGSSYVALGDPTGPASRQTELAWRFRELCDARGAHCVFYQVTSDTLPLYLDLGLSLAKLGEEARVPLTDFSLDGKSRAELRTAHRKGDREGLSFAVLEPGEVRTHFAELQQVSDQWLGRKSTAEKGFSIGRFELEYIERFACAVALRDGHIVAFANLHTSGDGEELSVDLMRYGDAAPKGVMDYLLVSVMLWGAERGFRWFDLGMAPLAGLEDHPLAPLWHKLGVLVHRYGEEFYNFDGLRRYKQKFSPVWRPRYLASPGGLALPRVLLDVVTLIAGGVKEVVRK